MSNAEPTARRSRLSALSFRNISAIYIFVVIFVIFSIVTPTTFLQAGVWRSLLDAQSITVIAALGVMIPLVTGSFNLAIGSEVGFAGILIATMQVKLGIPFVVAIPLVLLAGAVVGLVTGLIVTRGRIDSFIATLGTSSILLAGVSWLSANQQIIGLQNGFSTIAVTTFLGITVPTYLMIVLAIVVFYVLQCTSLGRRMYAAGYNAEGARLAGVNVTRLRIGALVAGGIIAAGAGMLLTSRLNTGDPTVGPGVLLPALTAVFLGSTQFKGGRFNVWGSLVAVYVIAVGIQGLQLIGAPSFISDLFNGIALLAAVGLSQWERTASRTAAIRRALPLRRKRAAAAQPVDERRPNADSTV